jgi:hypothetical protein
VIERVRKTIEFLQEALFQLVEAFVHCIKTSVDGVKAPVNNVEARLELLVLSREACGHGMENYVGLRREKFLDPLDGPGFVRLFLGLDGAIEDGLR